MNKKRINVKDYSLEETNYSFYAPQNGSTGFILYFSMVGAALFLNKGFHQIEKGKWQPKGWRNA